MLSGKATISACLVVYNEEAVIERCLTSIQHLVDEIIIVHDGPCADRTIEIAKKFTDKIFIKNHVGMMEGHLVFAFKQAKGDWILRIDADEYFESQDIEKIRQLAQNDAVNAYVFDWELWDGMKPVYFKGLQKMCLFRRQVFRYMGLPHEQGGVIDKNTVEKVSIALRHRPVYNNISWHHFLRKAKRWIPVHATYFFPALVTYECFNTTPDAWIAHARRVVKYPAWYLFFYPLKTLIAQLGNGLWKSWVGINVSLQQYVYYVRLYWQVWQMRNHN
jgi:glycosyltransferase involved in cell wall biosynthesis